MASKVEILSAGAVKPGITRVVASFERDTGHQVAINFATAPTILKCLRSGQLPDVVIAPPELLDEPAQSDNLAKGRVAIGRIGVGVMVRKGAAHPKIAHVSDFSRALLEADSVVYNQASTGIYLENLFDRLGVAAPLARKTTRCADFAGVLAHVSQSSGNEIGFGATTVILENAGNGVQWVGPLPAEIQNYTSYSAACTAHGDQVSVARALLDYLAAPAARAIFAATGIS